MSGIRYAWLWMLAACIVCFGCNSGPETVPVQGEVTYAGQPIAKGNIQFIPADGTHGRATGGSIVDGRYAISKADGPLAEGAYLVKIQGFRKTGKTMPNPINPKGEPVALEENYIPPSYNTQTTLKVVNAKSPLDFHLSTKP